VHVESEREESGGTMPICGETAPAEFPLIFGRPLRYGGG
jgi:hypothetical protein